MKLFAMPPPPPVSGHTVPCHDPHFSDVPYKDSAKFVVDNFENTIAPVQSDSASVGRVHDRCQRKQLLRLAEMEEGETEEVCDFVND
jgi:hypothetical protein